MIRFFLKLARGHFRRHRLEALLCLVGVALGVAVVVAIDSAVAACVNSFKGAVNTLAERSTHSIFSQRPGGISDEQFIALSKRRFKSPMAPVIDRGVLVRGRDGEVVGRLIGVDVFSERSLRSFTNMKSTLDDAAFRRFLTQPGQVVLVEALAARIGAAANQTISLTIGNRRVDVEVIGVVRPEGVARSQLTDLIIADLATAQELGQCPGTIDRIDLNIESEEDRKQVEAALPEGLVLRSTQQQSTSLSELIASYRLNLNSLSLMASFVAVFIVYNAMLVSVQQRVVSLGILRCLGSSRGQLVGLYLVEAAQFAAMGGVIGVLGGWALSNLLVGYISTTINDLYAAVRPGAVELGGAALAKGLGISLASCLVGALIPLWQASRTPPVNAMRTTDRARASGRFARGAFATGLLVLAASYGIYLLPIASPVVGFVIALLVALGFAMVCPLITRGVCSMVDAIARPRQWLPLRMAATGVSRSLGITGVAVAAMMLAMGMSVGVRTMVSSFRGALASWMERRFAADVFIGPELLVHHKIDASLDPAVEAWLTSQPQTAALIRIRQTSLPVAGTSTALIAVDAAEMLAPAFPIKTRAPGPFDAARDILISEPLAGRTGWRIGEPVMLDTPSGPRAFRVGGIYYDFGNERGQIMIERGAYAAAWNDRTLTSIHVQLKDNAQADTIAARWAGELKKSFPVAVTSYGALKTEVMTVFDRTFAVTDVLNWLAGGVAFCGLAGALLALSLARQRDYSVLAAIGMSSRQMLAWVLGQGLIIAVTSAAIAAVAGTVLAYVLSYVIQYRSFGWSIPTSPQPKFWIGALSLAALAAVVATLYPVVRLKSSPPAAALRQD